MLERLEVTIRRYTCVILREEPETVYDEEGKRELGVWGRKQARKRTLCMLGRDCSYDFNRTRDNL